MCEPTLERPWPKAPSLANRLNDATVHSAASAIDATFPPHEQEHTNRILNTDVVIDCTAEDSVVEHMRRFAWDGPITFISVSVGLKARRAFTYVAHGNTFPADDFVSKLDPWLRSEMEGYDEELPRDGTGCWHALMPARIDDIWIMTGAAVKTIESAIAEPPREPTLVVFEQQYDVAEGYIFPKEAKQRRWTPSPVFRWSEESSVDRHPPRVDHRVFKSVPP